MRIMAVDYGDVRTGVAVSDATLTLAGDAWTMHSKGIREAARKIADEAAKRDVSCIVVGYPKNMDGTIGERARKSEELADTLRSLCAADAVEVKLYDERLTTVSAHKILKNAGKHGKKRKQAVDAVAAALILETFLSSIPTA